MRYLALLVVTAMARDVAADAQADAVIKQTAALELARANRFVEALVAIDEAVKLAPGKPEPIYVRAGIRFMLAGEASKLENLGDEQEGVDYEAMVKNLEGAMADLRRYLELSPDAADRVAVLEAIGKLDARTIAARTHRDAILAREVAAQAEQDRLARIRLETYTPRTFTMADLSPMTYVGFEQTLADAGPQSAAVSRLHVDVSLFPWLKIWGTLGRGEAFSAGPDMQDGSGLANLTGAVRVVRGFRAASERRFRAAISAQYSVRTSGGSDETLVVIEGPWLASGFQFGSFQFAGTLRHTDGPRFYQAEVALERLFNDAAHRAWLYRGSAGGGSRFLGKLAAVSELVVTTGSVGYINEPDDETVIGEHGRSVYSLQAGVQYEHRTLMFRARTFAAVGGRLEGETVLGIGFDAYWKH